MHWEDGPLDPEEAGIDMSDAPECDEEDCAAPEECSDICPCSCHDEYEPDYEQILADREEARTYREE